MAVPPEILALGVYVRNDECDPKRQVSTIELNCIYKSYALSNFPQKYTANICLFVRLKCISQLVPE